ncbi:MAG: endosialidase [Lachnospiraceae bacterium]|nr:endosialidase [Lachnospiraceae bacterium]
MAVIQELLCAGLNDTISFGNHTLSLKAKLDDFEYGGNIWKVKTFAKMTKLEKNGMFVYESVPGTSVLNFHEAEEGITFIVEGAEDAQITVELLEDCEYEVYIGEDSAGKMKTNVSGKLTLSVELADAGEVPVKIIK